MRDPWTRLALLVVAGCLSAANARAGNTITGNLVLGNTAQRFVVIQTEDHTCTNTTQLTPGPLATGSINDCTVYANDLAATYTDLTNDYFGTLSFLGTSGLLPGDTNVYQISVDSLTWAKTILPVLKAANAALGTNTGITVLFDETSGHLASPSPSWTASAVYTLGTATLPLSLTGLPDAADVAYFAAPNATTGAGFPPALYDGQPLEFSCAFEIAQYPGGPGVAGSPGTADGPGLPAPWPGLCPATTAGLVAPPGFAGTAMTGFGMTTIALGGGSPLADAVWTALKWKIQEVTQNDSDGDGLIDSPYGASAGALCVGGTNAGAACTTNAGCGSGQCSGPGIPVGYFDNCPFAPNGPVLGSCTAGPAPISGHTCHVAADCGAGGKCDIAQTDAGALGTGSLPDGIGDVCQCGDVDNNGQVNGVDSNKVARAVANLTSPPGVTNLPGFLKCDVNASGTCDGTDSNVIARNVANLAHSIKQNCHAALTFP